MKRAILRSAVRNMTRKSSEPYTTKIVFSNGSTYVTNDGVPEITIHFTRARAEWRIILLRSIGFVRSYIIGDMKIEGDDALRKFLRMSFRAPKSKHAMADPQIWFMKQWQEFWFSNKNRKMQLANLRSHYALPSEFFHYMTGEIYGYTEGCIETGTETQNEAQYKKYHHMCRKLRLQPGDALVEVGTAWGSMALIAANEYGAQVTNYGLIAEQNAVFESRIKRMGLEGKVKNVVKDARDLGQEKEKYDKYVSLGVLEHAGVDCLDEWMKNISDCLKPGGTGVISFTGFLDHQLVDHTIFKNIWRGCYLPSLSRVVKIMEKYDLVMVDVEDARFSYADTMQTMLEKMTEHWEKIAAIDPQLFTDAFYRKWQIYYLGSMEGMRHSPRKQLHAFQMTFTKGSEAKYPESKRFLYEHDIDLAKMKEYEVPLQ